MWTVATAYSSGGYGGMAVWTFPTEAEARAKYEESRKPKLLFEGAPVESSHCEMKRAVVERAWSGDYQIPVLTGAEAVRRRPSLYGLTPAEVDGMSDSQLEDRMKTLG